MRKSLFASAAALCIAAAASGQSHARVSAPVRNPALERIPEALRQWRAEHGSEWRVRRDLSTGFVELLYGGRAEPVLEPRSDPDYVSIARHALDAAQPMHGLDAATLVEERVKFLPLGLAGTTDKMVVEFRQERSGVPVRNGTVNVLMATDGSVLAIDSKAMPGVETLPIDPQLTPAQAVARVEGWFRDDAGRPASSISAPRLVVDQVEGPEARRPVLVWEVDAQDVQPDEPAGWTYRVDVHDGRLVSRDDLIHFVDVSGTVRSMVTPGVAPDTASNPEAPENMPYISVTSPQGSTTTDANGNFTIVGANAPLQVTLSYNGLYHTVNNVAQADYSVNATLNFPTGNVVTMNPAPTEFVTAEANSYLWVARLRDWVRQTDPGDPTADMNFTSNVNINQNCNAFYNGASINFYIAGGGCVNSSYSTVVDHELGHWMNVLHGTGNGSDGMGEGAADVWAMYVTDSGVVAQDFFGPGSPIRNGVNSQMYWGDSGSCSSGVHTCGQVFMGAWWLMRVNLQGTHGQTQGGLIADALYNGWHNAYNQTQIKEIIVDQILLLDDNDGNLNNGTPNFPDINSAFVAKGFNGFMFDFVSFGNVTDLQDTANETGPYTVNADLTANVNPPIMSATLFYRVGGGAFTPIAMTNTGGSTWSAGIPGQTAPAFVDWYLEARDVSNNPETFPAGAPASFQGFIVGTVQEFFSEAFETPTDAGWTHGQIATQDDWQRGTPNGACGDPIGAFSGTRVWGNDLAPSGFNGCYQNNVNNWLRSPVLDLSGASNTLLRFKRWLTVQSGQFDQARIRVNGTEVWVNPSTGNLLDTAWTDVVLDISALADNNPSVQLEWSMQSNGSQAFGGWNIDDVEIISVSGGGGGPVTYCMGKLNSGGCVPFMISTGSPSASSTAAFQIIGNDVLVNEAGVLTYGINGRANLAFHNGTLCVKAPLQRTAVKIAKSGGGGACQGQVFFNFNNRIQSGLDPTLTVGQQVNAQWRTRDPGLGDGFNDGFTNGIEFVIAP